jgi:potassium efflux system protein
MVDARVQRLQTRQQLRNLQRAESVAKRFLDSNKVADTAPNIALMTSLVERRRAALVDLDETQGQLIDVLSEAQASDAQLAQDAGQLRSQFRERLLWLPSAAPLGRAWLQQLTAGMAWLTAPSNWSAVPTALASTLRTHRLTSLWLLAAIAALFGTRRRLAVVVRSTGDASRFTRRLFRAHAGRLRGNFAAGVELANLDRRGRLDAAHIGRPRQLRRPAG